jgi:hypothetical protein
MFIQLRHAKAGKSAPLGFAKKNPASPQGLVNRLQMSKQQWSFNLNLLRRLLSPGLLGSFTVSTPLLKLASILFACGAFSLASLARFGRDPQALC